MEPEKYLTWYCKSENIAKVYINSNFDPERMCLSRTFTQIYCIRLSDLQNVELISELISSSYQACENNTMDIRKYPNWIIACAIIESELRTNHEN